MSFLFALSTVAVTDTVEPERTGLSNASKIARAGATPTTMSFLIEPGWVLITNLLAMAWVMVNEVLVWLMFPTVNLIL